MILMSPVSLSTARGNTGGSEELQEDRMLYLMSELSDPGSSLSVALI